MEWRDAGAGAHVGTPKWTPIAFGLGSNILASRGAAAPERECMDGRNRFAVAVATLAILSLSAARVQTQAPAPFTIDGSIALWTVSIKPDKTADFERVMAKLGEALGKSSNPTRRQQLTGWRVMRIKSALPDGNIAYVHVIDPVIPGADYTVMQTLYDELPEERQALYELYRGAFVANLSLATGTIVVDMSQAPHAPGSAAP
jgi:hypothetical protein